jgi:DNA-binding MarR family transcriptional regulator
MATAHDRILQQLLAIGAQLSTATALYQQTIAARLGINATDHACLQIIMGTDPLTAGDLAGRMSLSAGAITGVIDRLEAAGFVRRLRDPGDRRRVIVEPVTAEIGRRVAPLGAAIHSAVAAKIQRYSEAELQLVLEYLSDSLDTLRRETARLQQDS